MHVIPTSFVLKISRKYDWSSLSNDVEQKLIYGAKYIVLATDLDIGKTNWAAAQANGSRSIFVWESSANGATWSQDRLVELMPPTAGYVSSFPQTLMRIPILTITGLGAVRNLGRRRERLRHLLVLRSLPRGGHRSHWALYRSFHILLAHQRLRHVHLTSTLEQRDIQHCHRSGDPEHRRFIVPSLPQRHRGSQAGRCRTLGRRTVRDMDTYWCPC